RPRTHRLQSQHGGRGNAVPRSGGASRPARRGARAPPDPRAAGDRTQRPAVRWARPAETGRAWRGAHAQPRRPVRGRHERPRSHGARSRTMISTISTISTISPMQRFYWSVRRELWENRSLYLAPLGVGALIVVASLIGAIGLPATLRNGSLDPARQQELVEQPYAFAALLLMFTTLVIGIFYCVDALQGER